VVVAVVVAVEHRRWALAAPAVAAGQDTQEASLAAQGRMEGGQEQKPLAELAAHTVTTVVLVAAQG
jgi:hypothetical protein